MPIYEYRCSKCGHALEALQRLADAPLSECPACHASALVKQVSAAGFQLKGSGWYVTDFRGGASGKSAESGDKAKADAKPDAKPEGGSKSESTPATKSDVKSSESSTTPTPATRPSDASG
jgi:putative FmdB family regulatory protein